jgi:hypothetical protein
MSSKILSTIQKTNHHGRRDKRVDQIALPDGDTLVPREVFANSVGISDRTARRMDFPTVFVAGFAFVKRNASLQVIADKVKRKNAPQKRRRA